MGISLVFSKMAKSKNHTSHNQGHKAHANGISKPLRQRYMSHHMVNQKLNRNTRRSRKFDPSIKKSVNYTKKIAKRITMKKDVLKKILDAKILKMTPKVEKPKKKEDKAAPKKEVKAKK